MVGVVWVGGEIGSYVPRDSNCVEVTTAGYFDSTYARCALATAFSSYGESRPYSSDLTDCWFHHTFHHTPFLFTESVMASFYNSSNLEVFRLDRTYHSSGDMTFQIYYWNGSAWVASGTGTATWARNVVNILDLRINVTGNAWDLYINGTLADSGTPTLSSVVNIHKHRASAGDGTTRWSEGVVSGTNTVGFRVSTAAISGAGNSNNWTTGTYADVDEIVYSDADGMTDTTNGHVAVFAVGTPTVNGYTVRAVAVSARARQGTLLNLQLALRSNGTNYFSASQSLSAGYAAFVNVWETDPNTSAAWVTAAAQAVQIGVKSIT